MKYKKHKKQKTDWSKEELKCLYWDEGKTLQQIGDLFGVTRERIKQVMEQYSIPRRDKWASQDERPHTPPFQNLEDYLARGKDCIPTMRRFMPANLVCSECGSKKHIHIHHIQYPARALEDIQILCNSCHFIKHRSGINYIQQIDIYNAYSSGVTTIKLSEQYNCSRILIYKIIAKIKNGYHSLKR